MNRLLSFRFRLPQLGTLLAMALLLGACAVQGGVPQTPEASPAALLPQPTDPAAAAALEARNDTWIVGLPDAPQTFYPYQPSSTSQRAAGPIIEALFPSPILAYGYGYTTTGVLQQIPTLENGGAEIRKADVYLDASGNITATVTEVITQVDQLVITYRWNPELRWSDGQPVTAQDSVFSYDLAKAAPPNAEARDRLANTLSYEAVDQHTTRAVLLPDRIGPTYFLHVWTPLPRHLLQGADPATIGAGDFARRPVGYGPYMIDTEQPSQGELRLSRSPHYFGPAPASERLVFAFVPRNEQLRANVLNGNLDVAATDRPSPEQFDLLDGDVRDGQAQVAYVPNPVWEHIDYNLDVRLLQDVRMRRAIALGTNRQGMSEALFDGHSPVLDSWVLPGQPEAAPPDQLTRYPYNPEEARRLLDELGYFDSDGGGLRANSDGLTLTLRLVTTDNPLRRQIAELFRDDMRAIGVNIEVQELPSDQLFAPEGPLYQRQFELALFGWGAAPNAGGLGLWSCNAVPSERNGRVGENFAGWCFRDADRAIRSGATSIEVEPRRAAYLQQQQLWTQELPGLPLFQRLSVVIAAPRVRGLLPDAFAPITWNVAQWQRGE